MWTPLHVKLHIPYLTEYKVRFFFLIYHLKNAGHFIIAHKVKLILLLGCFLKIQDCWGRGGGRSHVQVNTTFVLWCISVQYKGYSRCCKLCTLILLYLKLCSHIILSSTLQVWTQTWSQFLFIPLALYLVHTCVYLVKEHKSIIVGLICDYKSDILLIYRGYNRDG